MIKNHIGVIILAAGKGSRMKSDKNKQLLCVNGEEIISHTIKKFAFHEKIQRIVLVINPAEEEDILTIVNKIQQENACYIKRNLELVIAYGGNERYNSVYNGMKKLGDIINLVLVHDGARPLISKETIDRVILQLEKDQAVVPGVLVKDTCKLINEEGFVEKTLKRNFLYSVQTPQGFHKKVLEEAYEQGINKADAITDDSMMVEKYSNVPVRMVEGDYENIKITTPEDVDIMIQILTRNQHLSSCKTF